MTAKKKTGRIQRSNAAAGSADAARPATRPRTRKKTGKKVASSKQKTQGQKTQAAPSDGSTMADETITISLATVITIADVAALKETLMVHGDQQATVCIDAGGVQMIDTAGLQLLLAFIRQRQAQNRDCTLLQPSQAFTDTAALLGLTEPLGLPV